MQRHGGGPDSPAKLTKDVDPVTSVDPTGTPRGFRHYVLAGLGSPQPRTDPKAAARAARLDTRMTAELGWAAAPDALCGAATPIRRQAPDPHDNPYIPSGYTYLSQFVAHDMVSTRIPFWATTRPSRETVNDRDTRLRLDALYAGGPFESPMLYAPTDTSNRIRVKLQIGRAGSVPLENGGTVCPFRDIARLQPQNTLCPLPGLTEALVADARNDDHAIISQLTMVFSHLHNIFVDLQEAIDDGDPAADLTRAAWQVFENARAATTLVYRRVIRDDLLKRILHPDVHAAYATGATSFLDLHAGEPDRGLPLEFSHAAFRFGHAMVRQTYQINQFPPVTARQMHDGLQDFSSTRNVNMAPMLASWIVNWSNFFDISGHTDPELINLSQRIGPRAPLSLFGFEPVDGTKAHGLMYRDLVSAELAALWRVPDLLAAMRAHPRLGPIVEASPFLRGDAWRQAIKDWLPQGNFPAEASPWQGVPEEEKQADIDALSEDPPLPFFILFEAFKDPDAQGCRLGRFGSILVADTLFGELHNKLDAEAGDGTLQTQLQALHAGFTLPELTEPVRMASVLRLIDTKLQQTGVPEMMTPPLLGPFQQGRGKMPFIPVEPTGTYKEWGELVLSWAMGTASPPGDKGTDDTVTIFKFTDGQPKQIGTPGAGVVFPDSVEEVVFVRDTSKRRYVRLPDPDMAKAAQDMLRTGSEYSLPRFYSDPPLGCRKPTTPTQNLVLQAERVGDYSIGSCM